MRKSGLIWNKLFPSGRSPFLLLAGWLCLALSLPAAAAQPSPATAQQLEPASPSLSELWEQGGDHPPLDTGANTLDSIVLNVNGQAVAIKNGGVLALHPDSSFLLLEVKPKAWLHFGFTAGLAGRPETDLSHPQTLHKILQEDVYQREYIDLQAWQDKTLAGAVRIMVRFAAIDWLRQADASSDYSRKVYAWYRAWLLGPDDPLLTLNLLDGLRRLGRLEQALLVLAQYPGLQEDSRMLLLQGNIYHDLGRSKDALASTEAALKLDPDNSETMRFLADLYQETGQEQQAAVMLETLLQRPPFNQDPQLWLRLARLLAAKPARVAEALRAYEQYGRLAGMNAALWMEIAQAEETAGLDSLAAKEQALTLDPGRKEIILEVAKGWRARDQAALAAGVLENGLRALPQDEELWRELISLYWETDNAASLINAYKEYIKIRPDQAVLYYELGLSQQKNGQLSDAAASLEKAWRLEPGNYDYTLNFLMLKVQLKEYDQALNLARALLESNTGSLSLWESLYAVLAKDRPAELGLLLEQWLADKARPAAKFYEMRALLALEQDKPEEAAEILESAAETYPSSLRILFLLGNIYEGMGQDSKAMIFYEKVMGKDPAYSDVGERYLQTKIRLLGNR
jgi:tetratricopeptide (TPR) repeat protein